MKTAVVILNWNGVNYLRQFLPTLVKNTNHARIIVVDNQSTDESVNYLEQTHPEIEVIINPENGGFAKGYNDGLQQIKGRFDYYLLLNSDIEVTPNWLVPLEKKMDSNEKIGGVQPKILSFSKQNTFEHAGASGGYLDKDFFPFCRGRIFDKVEEDHQQYDHTTEIFWATGACMLVRAKLFHELGGFDNDFFAHMEEIDFCWRAKKQNFSFFVVPQSKVYHVGGGTLSYQSPRKTYLNFRNSLFMIHKNYEGWLAGKIIRRLILDGFATFKFISQFKFEHIGAIMKAHFSYYQHIPTLRKKRKQIQSESTQFNSAGLYKSSILWGFFFKKITTFDKLNKRFFS